jgi:hypothetical protein
VVAGTKVQRPIQNNHSGRSSAKYRLPTWFSSRLVADYTSNTTMPCLQFKKQALETLLGEEVKVTTVGRFGGVYCPVHLCHPGKPNLHIHGSNGVYVGIQVHDIVYNYNTKFIGIHLYKI